MKNYTNSKAITTGGILAAIYLVVTLLSVYVLPILSVFGLMIMPILSAYYASIFDYKQTIVFNIATLVVTFISGISDPFYCLLYVLPTLIIGDLFGLFNKLKIKYYTTIFLQTIAYSVTNILALYLGEFLYDTKIIEFIMPNEWMYQNLSLTILFILSGAEAIFSSMFIYEQLKKLSILKAREKEFPWYGNIAIIVLTILATIFYFVSNNFYFLFFVMAIIIAMPLIYELINKIKYKNIFLYVFIILFASLNFLMCYFNLALLIPLICLIPISICSIVKTFIYIYNKCKLRG